MSRGLVILIVVLSLALAALLVLPKLKHNTVAISAPANTNTVAAATPVTEPVQLQTPTHAVRPTNPQPPRPTEHLAPRSNPPSRLVTIVTNDASITNLLGDPPEKTLPELERDYASTTNRDTRLDIMMDVAEAANADSIKVLTRLFELEKDNDLKVDLLDSLLGIDGFKDEKLIMLTLGVRQGLPNDVRQSAIDGLIDLEDNRSISLLNGLLNDPDPEIRQSAQDAIEIIQTPPAQIPKLKP
jgi:hypothetical protein